MKEDDKATLSKEENPVFDSKVETSDKMLKKTPISPYNQVNSSINLEPGAWMKLLASTDGKDKIVKALSYWGLSFVWTLSETKIVAHAVQGDSLIRSLYTSTVTLHESRRLFHFGSFFKMLLAPSNADTMNPCVRWITIMKSFLEDFALFLNSDTLLHTKFVGAVVRQPKVIWGAILLLKLFLIGVELNALVRRLLHQSWGIVMHMKHFRCSNPRGCNNRFPPCWSLKTTNMDPNHSCGGRMSDGTAATSCPMQTVSAMCRRCGNNLPIDALKRDLLSMQGQEISIWTIPYVLRYLQGFFWLMGYKKCEFHVVFWRIIELLCEAVSGMARLLYRDLEPFSPLRNSFDPVPRQRLIVILGALISSYLSLKRLLN